ncbi:Laminin subunit alpha-1 like protein [Argiope bruennichi]|uniref:Acyl-CoA-binding domain-containing protein 6 n=1 Tax=Argiope bruennichi TaxID=94029 RepID=A0A8T0FT81_ARGBR|nr:Laminin subunit alpha-1 like protein [Argiope bruennichi]
MEDDDFLENEDDALETSFKLATDFVTENASVMQQDDLLFLYGRYKQATVGVCNEPMPGILKFKSRSKWSAWHELGNMTKEEAMKQYIKKVSQISPDWDAASRKESRKKSHFGPVNSTCQKTDVDLNEDAKTVFDFVKEGNLNRIKELISSKSSLKDCCDEGGLSLLHWACDRGQTEIAEFLISEGTDINFQDKDGQTPLHYASSCGHEEVINLLLKKGAVTNIYDADGLTPADVAYKRGLFPSVNNLAANAIISTNATCGETEPEVYCKLVEHVFMREPQCGLCDARSELPEHRHPIINAIDGTNKWWQSPTLQNGKHFEWVTITLDLKQVFQIAYVIIKSAISPRPGNWILERSLDGLIYKPWQYYAISDAECWEAFGVRPTMGKPRYRSDSEVICTSYYSKLNPLEGGEIHTSLVSGRPGAEGPSDTLREFTTARFVRLRLQKIRTLNADLMTMQSRDPSKIDKSTTRRYFYSIKDISVGGQCVCYGHAKDCPLDPETNLFQCKCEHNTCGENCEQCCPLYQQKPWQPGNFNDGAVCEKCQCYGHADICFYDQTVADKRASLNINEEYEGGGVCIKCKHHTTGINCEQCEDGYYRPLGVERSDPTPCRRCRCAGPGVTGFCIKDDTFILEGVYPGDCICKEGFAGSKCDHCALGFKQYPICEPCPCSPAGTEGETTCEGRCICKKNVEGAHCEYCKYGHYNMDSENSDGCTPCYCSGITNRCRESDWGVKVISSLNGWRVTDLYGLHVADPEYEGDYLKITNEAMLGFDNYYWMAPPEYIGKKLYSYGGDLRYVIGYTVIEDNGIQNDAPGIIIESDPIRIGYYFGSRKVQGNITVTLPLQERPWSHLTAAGKRSRAVSKETFAAVMNNITRLLIRAKYHSDQIIGVLYNVEMEIADRWSSSIKKMQTVEMCECPLGYSGLSCEICETGYRRVNDTLHKGVCELCECNGHSTTCDPYTGYCLNCAHNTTGHHCEMCVEGFHGNPYRGTSEDCQPCACPLLNPENNFSPVCRDIVTTDAVTDYVCTACAVGYTGSKCERCAPGYFGTPGIPGGSCQPCDCTGNVDTSDPNYCDHITGQCLKCIGNTGGWNCNECLEGHYGNAYHHICKPCGCSPLGSESSICDRATGVCECKPKFVGRECDRCDYGFGNVELGCVPCRCNKTGTKGGNVDQCDPVTGKCDCKPGVFGLKCDTCLEGYYSFSENGCKWCGCDVNGAASIQCEDPSGQCKCKPEVTGLNCSQCKENMWNLLSGKGCEDCQCNVNGSVNLACDELYGTCKCRPGVGGAKCDMCLHGYFGFSPTGCKKCEPCENSAHICDPITGACACPPNTEGDFCQRCTSSSWGHDAIQGCKLCNCNPRGSVPDSVCDVENGNCLCLEGYEGRSCDKCRFSYYRFPNCLECRCRYDGTLGSQCTAEGLCQCDEVGQCPCKENVEGYKCDECKRGTFGLSVDNPKGCYECFCFNRSKLCEQAEMVWSQITTPAREVQFELGNTPLGLSSHKFLLIPGQTGNVKLGISYTIKQPIYWMLPKEFLGEKTRSYNGVLKFSIESRSSRRYPNPLLFKYPVVVLEGNARSLVHSPFLPISGGRYSVRLHEDQWTQYENPEVRVTRSLMMLVLQNVHHILIRATEGADVKIARLKDVSMEIAVPLSPTPASPYVAVGIEVCTCPEEYGGLSCQDPGNKLGDTEEESDERRRGALFMEIQYNGGCTPHLAECPLVDNSFSDTCEGDIYDHNCTNCLPGYEGKHCERCSLGYYGVPTMPGGSCQPCNCNPYGSLDRVCDRMTGQCYCRRGIGGRDCTMCSARHILTDVGCKSCDDECIGPLLNDAEFLKAISNYFHVLDVGLNISQNFEAEFDFETLADLMYLRGRDINIRGPHLAFNALEVKEDAEILYKLLDKIWTQISESVQHLQEQGSNLNFSNAAVAERIVFAEMVLEEMKKRDIDEIRQEVEREMRKASQISEAVKNAIMNVSTFSVDEEKINNLTKLFSEFIHLIERKVRLTSVQSSVIVCDSREVEETINRNLIQVENDRELANKNLEMSSTLLTEALDAMQNISYILEKVIPLQELLENATEQLEYHRGILARLNPRYIQKFVIPAADHAEHLSQQATYLSNLFSATKTASQFPLLAAKVYDDIINLVEGAEQVAKNAYTTADRAFYEADPKIQDSISNQAIVLRKKSEMLLLRSNAVKEKVQGKQEILSKQRKTINQINEDIKLIVSSVADFKEDMDSLPRNIGDRLHDSEDMHKSIKDKMTALHSKIEMLTDDINTKLYPKLDGLRIGSSAGLFNVTKTIDLAKGTINKAVKKANNVETRVGRVKNLNNQMQLSLRDLKNKILLARQKTSNIRISLSADSSGICVRSFRPEIEPTSTSSIVLHYSVKTDAKDSLLLFLASSVSEDFMIVEMVNRKIRFIWNAGGGSQVIQHNLTIETNDEQLLKDDRWYKIEINRFGNVATLSVKPTPSGQKSDPYAVTGASPAGYSKMDLDSDSFFYIGGTPKGYRVPRELKARNFAGCLSEVVLEGKKVGLWNFITNQGCDGCKEGAAEEADFTAYSFRGDGYAILPQIKRYKKRSYVVTLRFKTFDEDALLFFAPNIENGDFVSLELRDGYVVYQFNLGSQSRSVLKTNQKYNTGNWVRLAAERENLQGRLAVEDEYHDGQLPANSNSTMELQKSFLYYGGVPPNFTINLWSGITFQKFFGCMKDLQIDSTPLDLLQNSSFGVEASCKDIPQKSVGFRGSGFIEMPGIPLNQEASFSFSFQTMRDSAVLLLSTFDSGKNFESKRPDYYSVAIVNGFIEARFDGGNGEAIIESNKTYNDGNYHTVTVIKTHRKVVMRVDDEEVGSDRLPKGSKDIDAPPQRGLYFGGFREGIEYNSMLSTATPLFGTIKDVIFNNKILYFSNPVDFKGAGIGRTQKEWFGAEPPYAGIVQPLERCSEMASYNQEKRAVNFGDELFSHAKVAIGRKDFVHDFNVTFDLRTYYPNGLIALVKNGHISPVSHFAIMLLGGRAVINLYDRKARRVSNPSSLNDGNWHHISIIKVGRHLSFRVDDKKKPLSLKVRRRLTLRSPLYVGGVPEEMEAIHKVVMESFKGCIRNFHLNGKYLDIASGELQNVGHCFQTIEPGAYFSGDAFAIYASDFDLGIRLDIQMEFKTTRQNGLLLALSEGYGVPSIALEIDNGSIIISVLLGNEEKPFSAIRTFESSYYVCDGQWHMVTAQYAHKSVTLKVDLFDVTVGMSHTVPLEPNTASPLYIGGIPDNVPTGAAHNRNNFIGCLRNIAINDRRVEWIDMAARHNVLSNACPTF